MAPRLAPRVRPYAAGDFDRVLAIAVAAFAPIHAGFERVLGPDLFAAEYGDWRAGYAATLRAAAASPATRIHVVEIVEAGRGAVVAFALATLDPARRVGELGLNAVAPDHQRRGIGRMLHAAVLADLKARGARFAYVGTGGGAAHVPARAAYAAAGFDRAIPSVHCYRAL